MYVCKMCILNMLILQTCRQTQKVREPGHYSLCAQLLSCVWLFVTLRTVAHQAPLSMGFSRQEHWSKLPSHLQGIFLTRWENLHLLRLQFERAITNPDQFAFTEVRTASLMLGEEDRYQKQRQKPYKLTPNPQTANLWPKLSAQMTSTCFSPSHYQATWKLPSPEHITLRALSTSEDYTSQNTVKPHPPARFRLRPRCFLGVVVSNGTGVEAGKSPEGKPTWHKDLGWEYCLYKPKALGRPEITFHFTLSSRLALWPRHPRVATTSDGLQSQQRFA